MIHVFLFKNHFLLHILRFLFFFLDNMADVASEQQTTALVLSNSHTHKKTHRTDTHTKKKLTNLIGNLWCVREHSVVFRVAFFLNS